MNPKILEQAQKVYDLSKKAGLVGDFDSVFGAEYLTKLEGYMKEAKEKALKPRFGVTFDESLWDDSKETERELIWQVINASIENNRGYIVDWKASADDTVFNIKRILPEAKIEYLGEEQIRGDWFEKIDLNGSCNQLPMENDDLMIDRVANLVNPYLEDKHNLILMTTDIGDDDHYYLLIKKESEQDFVDLGFFRP